MIRRSLAIFAVLCALGVFTYHQIRNSTNLLRPGADMNTWRWQQGSKDVSGGVTPDQDGLRIDVIKTDGVDWHLQLFQESVSLKEGHTYRFSFVGKSSVTRKISTVALNSEYPGSNRANIGLNANFTLDNHWKEQEATFLAKGVDGRFSQVPLLYFGAGPPATIWMKDTRLEQIK